MRSKSVNKLPILCLKIRLQKQENEKSLFLKVNFREN